MSLLKTKLQAVLAEKNAKVIPTNIRAGVTILGVAGTVVEEDPEHADYDDCVTIADEILGTENENENP